MSQPPEKYRYEEAKPVDIHAQRWAEYQKHGKEPAPAPEKIGIALRIGVFFDGTGNNRITRPLGCCGRAHPIAQQIFLRVARPSMGVADSSYGADATNINKLADLYYESPIGEGEGAIKKVSRPLYIEGIGTRANEKDSLVGQGMGRGETGVAGRVQTSFTFIKQVIEDALQENPNSEIASITFDTFGFSRGAAAARHFSNEIVRGKQGR